MRGMQRACVRPPAKDPWNHQTRGEARKGPPQEASEEHLGSRLLAASPVRGYIVAVLSPLVVVVVTATTGCCCAGQADLPGAQPAVVLLSLPCGSTHQGPKRLLLAGDGTFLLHGAGAPPHVGTSD